MNKLYRLLLLCLLLASVGAQAQAPDFMWAKQSVGTTRSSIEHGRSVARDATGNTYTTGSFGNYISFGSTMLTSSGTSDVSSGSTDIFIVKHDASGNTIWAQRAGGTSFDYGYGIALDASGNAYVTGSFQGTASFGNITLTSSGNNDIFVAKYDASGNVLWAQKAGGSSSDNGYGIAVDGSGNAYVTGSLQGAASFGHISLTSRGYNDAFVAKYDASGNVLWAQRYGDSVEDYGYGISVDASGNAYVTGWLFHGYSFFWKYHS
ncbi:ribosomal protein S11 [Pontibacter aydingkolensis]|uniref:SBBP repeat-containing protein n=1 Tax=Pontibacter aydingkolensis TaxID=1911536 RepID=A0ABS7CUL9_9BACT|nr:SBBP repeat-containing protein [Pontibacter aydingkolensis]MBW7467458.1 SBBP repeat-containing protein [Pontibacter aydingkolensis]